MVREELYINGTSVELQGSLQPNLTFNIQDIEEPDKRKSTYSKSITLPGSKTINNLFNFIFEISTEGTFNPNVKATAKYLVDSQIILDGILQLKEIKYLDNSKVEYEVVLLGTVANLFTDLGELELTDIQNLSDFDHDYTEIEQALSWDTTYQLNGTPTAVAFGSGYVYPMINYGMDNTLDSYDYDEMYPAMYAKELWDRIFSDAGYTYSSNFLNTDKRFKQAIIPFNGLGFGISSAQIANRTFTSDTPVFSSSLTGKQLSANSYVSFTDVTDTGAVHSGGTFTAPSTGTYQFQTSLAFNASFYPDASATETVRSNMRLKVVLLFEKTDSFGTYLQDSAIVYISPDYTYDFPIGGSFTTGTTPTYPDDEYNSDVTGFATPYTLTNRQYDPPNRVVLNSSTVWFDAGDTIKVKVVVTAESILSGRDFYLATANANEYSGLWDLNITGTGAFKNTPINTEYMYGDTVDMNGAVPQGVKQKDYIKSIMNMFNLYMESDVDNPNQLNIEPRDNFLNANTVDWSEKLDVSQDLVFTPMGLLDAGRYLYTYKKDKDYYNGIYTDLYNETYGEREIIVDNDFVHNTKKSEIIFSPTPLVGQNNNDRVVSSILKVDNNNQAKRTDSNIRYLIYDGLKATTSLWTHRTTSRSTYPYAGHFYPDPFNPTSDVNFGLPREIYYDDTYYPLTLTDNNLYNSEHRKQTEEITDPDSKIVKGMFYLTPLDISNLSFKPQYYFNRHQHRLLKVVNYNPANVALTECHFLKLKVADSYTPITLVPDGGKDEEVGSGSGSTEPLPLKSLSTEKQADGNTFDPKNADVNGEDNYVNHSARSVEVYGDRNRVSDGTFNIKIQGDNNFILANLSNVNLINTSNVNVSTSNTTYINGEIIGSGSVVSIADDTIPSEQVTTYLCTTTPSKDITITLPSTATVGKVWNFKKVSVDGIVKIRLASPALLDGIVGINIEALNNSYTVQFDGVNYKII